MTTDTLDRAESLLDELWEIGIRPTSLELRFAFPLMRAFDSWVQAGRFAGRSLGDLLFHEWERDEGNFVHFVQQLLVDGYRENPEIPLTPELLTHATIINAAINTDPPERVIALFAEEAALRASYSGGDEYDEPAEPLLCADEWRRMFATTGWCPSELPDPNGHGERDITMDRCRACGRLRGSVEVEFDWDGEHHTVTECPDPCLGMLPGVGYACCGHGLSGKSVRVNGLSGPAAAREMRELGGNPPEAAFLEETPAE